MKILRFLLSILVLFLFSITIVSAKDCNEFDKLSKEFAKCTSKELKNKTTKKADEIKKMTSEKIQEGKKKFHSFKFKEKLLKFKNSKTGKEFTQK